LTGWPPAAFHSLVLDAQRKAVHRRRVAGTTKDIQAIGKGHRLKHTERLKKPLLLASLWVAMLAVAPVCTLVGVKFAAAAEASVDPARLAAAKDLMEATGSAKQFDAILPLLTQQLEGAFVKLRPDQANTIKEVFRLMPERFSQRKQEAFDQVAVVFAQNFTADELKELARFYRSPVGAKYVQLQPELFKQSMAIGQAWGRKIGQQIEQEVRQELKQRGVPI
jgi:hypothetical protein